MQIKVEYNELHVSYSNVHPNDSGRIACEMIINW